MNLNQLPPYVDAACKGALMGVLTFPWEHPLDTIKTKAQANPNTPIITLISNLFREEGYRGFYRGAVPNALKSGVKLAWKIPLALYVPEVAKENLSLELRQNHPSLIPLVTATVMASTSIVTCPFERLKVILVTAKNDKDKTISGVFKQYKTRELAKELFQGLDAICIKQFVSWGSFLVVNKSSKDFERWRTGEQELSFTSDCIASAIVGIINTASILPFDAVKTRKQKAEALKMSFAEASKTIYKEHGIRGFYAGWQPRLVHYMVYAIFFNNLLKKYDI